MKANVQQAYDSLPPEVQEAMDRLILSLSQQSPAEDKPKFNGLKGYGSMKGQIWMADDFDEPLDDFKDYM